MTAIRARSSRHNTDPVAGTRFRRAVGRLPTGVAIVTASDEDRRPAGMTVASVTCASYDPPMIAFFAQVGSRTAEVVLDRGRFGVNVLGRGHEDACYRFGSSDPDRFTGLDVVESERGTPRLECAILWLECSVDTVLPTGDHLGFVGRVLDYDAPSSRAQPLVYCKSRIAPLHGGSARHLPTESLTWWGEP